MKHSLLKYLAIIVCALCVSSAQGAIVTLADWNGTSAVAKGWGVNTATPATFGTSYKQNTTGSQTFTVTLLSGYSASVVSLLVTYNVSKLQAGQSVTVSIAGNIYTYTGSGQNGNNLSQTISLGNISTGGSLSFNVGVSANSGGTVDFTDVKLTGNVVPEPINYALAGFGLVFVGGAAGRRYLFRRQQS